MWMTVSELLADRRMIRVCIQRDSAPVSYAEVLYEWQHDAEFRIWFNALLAETPYAAFRWETPPITVATAVRPFEFALLDSPGLAQTPDAIAFAEHFRQAPKDGVVEFSNLGRDAILVAPCPQGPLPAYGHLGTFVRHAPEPQKNALWRRVSTAMQHRLSNRPVWLSTAGAGVSWLHVRLDDRPKYYGYKPYCK
jgi:hypothetical protein